MGHVTLHLCDLPAPLSGVTDGRTVWLFDGLTQAQRRCVLAHELVHVRLGHGTRQPDAVERQVRAITARYLLPDIRAVGEVVAWAHDHDEASEELWVTPGVLADRLEGMTGAEREWLSRRLA